MTSEDRKISSADVCDVYEFHDSPEFDPATHSQGLQKSSSSLTISNRQSIEALGARSSSLSIHIGPPPIKRARPVNQISLPGSFPCTSGMTFEEIKSEEDAVSISTYDEGKKVPPLRMRIFLSKNNCNEGNSRFKMGTLKKPGECDEQQLSTRGRLKREYDRIQNVDSLKKTTHNESDAYKMGYDEADSQMLFDTKSDENSRSSYSDDGSQTRSDMGQISGSSKTPNSGVNNVLNSLLALNSYEQALSFRDMVEFNWVKLYKERHANLVDSVATISSCPIDLLGVESFGPKTLMSELSEDAVKNWPESLRKIALMLVKRRHELAESHSIECQNLLKFAEREYFRITQRDRLQLFPIVKILNDSEIYNYDIFINEITAERNQPQIDKDTKVSQLLTRLRHLALTTKNRQTMEAQSLFVCQKAEWEKGWKLFQKRLINSGGATWSADFDKILAKMVFVNTPLC